VQNASGPGTIGLTLKSQAISHDLETLEQQVSDLRAQAEADSSSFAALEAQLSGLKDRLAGTQGSLSEYEARIADKQAELAEAKRSEAAEAYQETFRAREEAAARAAQAATNLLAELEAYDQATRTLQELIDDLRRAPGEGFAAPDLEEPEVLREPWESLVAAVKLRINEMFESELVETAASSVMGKAIEDLPEHLQELAQSRRRARIKAYLGSK
jgi:predicted  nucleic acid-binding Zn-ribbon protein